MKNNIFSYMWIMCRYLPATILLFIFANDCKAQQKPPRPMSVFVSPAQGLMFGAFIQGVSGGTVTVNPDGSRSSTGDLILTGLGFPYSPAIFEVEAQAGTLINIMNGPDVVLTGDHGGTVTLHIGPANTGAPFIATVASPGQNEVRIGGTLTVGNAMANPSGSYSGSFTVIFIQE